jgi:beta-alanine degradation protein BauB
MPSQEFSARKLSRREALRLFAATGGALTLGGAGPNPLGERRTLLKTTARDAAAVTPNVVKVKLENDRVRVLDYISAPGDKEDWHTHPAFVVYIVTGGMLRISTPDGKSRDEKFKAGDIRYREPVTHSTENIGKTELHAIIVELA